MTDHTALARAWIEGLAARSVRVEVKNNRVRLRPDAAFKSLTDAEYVTLRRCRDEIKALVQRGIALTSARESTPGPKQQPEAPVTPPCPYCGRECIGPDHSAYRTLHGNDPAEVERRYREATAVMRTQVRFGHPTY